MINIKKFVKDAIDEDIGRGDLFFNLAPKEVFTARVISKDDGILAGELYGKTLAKMQKFECEFLKHDGDFFKKGDVVGKLQGKASTLLLSERIFLNMLQHASGIATMTNKFVKKIEDLNLDLLDTRKTRPQLRNFEKYASKIGGAINHRLGLDDSLMLKDTHLKTIKNLKNFIINARKSIPWTAKIEVECETFEQAKEAMDAKADIVMCDNMGVAQIKEVVEFRNKQYPNILLEASGNISLDTIRSYALTGVNALSIGSIIHQATWLDFSLKFD